MKSWFALGNHPLLSASEIYAALSSARPLPVCFGSSVMVIGHDQPLNYKETVRALGGTQKIGSVEIELTNPGREEIIQNAAAAVFAAIPQGKIKFGLSAYLCGERARLADAQTIGLDIKRALESQGRKARWVTSREPVLSSVAVKKNDLLAGGTEIVLISDGKRLLIGRTLAVQEFEEYGFRDFGRPGRDPRSGMLPPKLAKMVLNLARAPKNALIVDPFCGSGTIITEAMLLGYKNLVGSDLAAAAVATTQANVRWIKDRYPQSAAAAPRILEASAEKIGEKIPPKSAEAIVTEPYLGPPLAGAESERQILATVKELSALYITAFKEWRKILKTGGRAVVIFPVFRRRDRTIFLKILPEIKKLGYEIFNPLPPHLPGRFLSGVTPRGSLIYSRPGQRVLREIFVFTFKG